MPGAYAHIAAVNAAQKMTATAGLRRETSLALGRELHFVELGSVSPDYPYLALKAGQSKWADSMHYKAAGILLREGVNFIRGLQGSTQQRATAWLMGFGAHMATDMTIHPVVERLVGPYKENKGEHRRCEMHQDAYIFPRILDVGETHVANHLSHGIGRCHMPSDPNRLDEGVAATWLAMLKKAYPQDVHISTPLPDAWHAGFQTILNSLGAASQFFPFSRHVAANLNINYPTKEKIDKRFILSLNTPEEPMSYLDLFERACKNVLFIWKEIDQALGGKESQFFSEIGSWDLDTGRDCDTKAYVFWSDK